MHLLAADSVPLAAGIVGTALVVGIHFYFKNVFSYWSRQGVDGPPTLPFVGHLLHLFLFNRVRVQRSWLRRYGKCFGIYHGLKPRLFIADPEVVREICVKEFETFPNHERNEFLNHFQKNTLFFLHGLQWKRARAIMSPTFTSGKIKRMFYLLDVCSNDLVANLRDHLGASEGSTAALDEGKVVCVKDVYNLYAMDGITSCCYSIKLERAGASDLKKMAARDDFVRDGLKPFDLKLWRMAVAAIVPPFILRWFKFTVFPASSWLPLIKKSQKLLDDRLKQTRDNNKRFDDYMQLLIDAKLDQAMELDDNDLTENHHAGLTHESLLEDQKRLVEQVQTGVATANGHTENGTTEAKSANGLSSAELISGVSFFLMVGLETTGNLLSTCTYLLAFHPEVQERLYREISAIATFDEKRKAYSFEYDSLTSCQYLDAVISESLRIVSPVWLLDRRPVRDYYIEKYKVHVSKDNALLVAVHALHMNPEYWPEPDKYNPDRFMPGNKEKIVPGSYVPFGMGPRHCIGMRFSLTESKLAIAKVLMHFKFKPAPQTSFPSDYAIAALTQLKTPLVTVVPRASG